MFCGAIQSVQFSSSIHYGRRDEILGNIAHVRATLWGPHQTSLVRVRAHHQSQSWECQITQIKNTLRFSCKLRRSSPYRWHWNLRSRWSPLPRCTRRADVNLQLSDRTAQCIPVYAESLGSFALVPSLILEHCQDESLLKFPYRFRASHTGSIHLQDNTL